MFLINQNASNITAHKIVGIPVKSAIFAELDLLIFRKRDAAIIIPALEAPGIRARDCIIPINIDSL